MPRGTLNKAARWALATTAGGVLCVVGDHLHVTHDVLFYPHPVFWGQAWWVFPLFAAATLNAVGGVRLVYPVPTPPAGATRSAAVLEHLVVFALAYATTAIVPSRTALLFGLATLFLVDLVRGMPRRLLLFCVLVAIAGTSWEMMWSGIGMFTYRHPDMLGVPAWLPLLYLQAALAADSARRLLDAGADEGETPRIPANPP